MGCVKTRKDYDRERYLKNKAKILARQKARYAALTPEERARRNEYGKKWRSKPENRAKDRLRAKKRSETNPDYARRWYLQNRERVLAKVKLRAKDPRVIARRRETQRRWEAAHPEKIRAKMEKGWAFKLLRSARHTSKRKGRIVSIDVALLHALLEKQGGACYWTGVPMLFSQNSPWTISLDRLDSDGGYTHSNVVLCSWWANHAKGRMSGEKFREIIEKIRTAPPRP